MEREMYFFHIGGHSIVNTHQWQRKELTVSNKSTRDFCVLLLCCQWSVQRVQKRKLLWHFKGMFPKMHENNIRGSFKVQIKPFTGEAISQKCDYSPWPTQLVVNVQTFLCGYFQSLGLSGLCSPFFVCRSQIILFFNVLFAKFRTEIYTLPTIR